MIYRSARRWGGSLRPLLQLVDDLLWCMPLPWHASPFLRSMLLTLHLDQFSGGGGRSIRKSLARPWRLRVVEALGDEECTASQLVIP